MGSTCNSRLKNLARTSIPLYVTIEGSLNISLSNNPAFLEGHSVRVEPLEVIIMSAWLPLLSACNL